MEYYYIIKNISDKFVTLDVIGGMVGVTDGGVIGQTVIDKKTGLIIKSNIFANVGKTMKTTMKITTTEQ